MLSSFGALILSDGGRFLGHILKNLPLENLIQYIQGKPWHLDAFYVILRLLCLDGIPMLAYVGLHGRALPAGATVANSGILKTKGQPAKCT